MDCQQAGLMSRVTDVSRIRSYSTSLSGSGSTAGGRQIPGRHSRSKSQATPTFRGDHRMRFSAVEEIRDRRSGPGRADPDGRRVDATALLAECRDASIRPLFDLDQPVVREVTEELPEPLPAVLPLRGVVDADAGAEFLQRQFVELR